VSPATTTINEALERFIADAPSAEREGVVDLLRSYLDGYGHEVLEPAERTRWEAAYERDEDAGSFCNLFGPERIVEGLDAFLGWFMIRKVLGPPGIGAAAGRVCGELVTWLVGEGHVDPAAADGGRELAAAAERDLPLAEELAGLLWEATEEETGEALEYVDWESERAEVFRIERGQLWFRSELGEIGPVLVPERASEIARLGWEVSALACARTSAGWRIAEVGNVYPA
jgi:hypothetical protein